LVTLEDTLRQVTWPSSALLSCSLRRQEEDMPIAP
jgi:hypothetical protein